MWAPLLPTVSISHAVLRTSSRSCSIRTRDSAIQSRTTPWSAIGLPKATRSAARLHISSIGALGDAERAHAVVDAAGPEPGLGDREALALAADQVGRRHPHVVEPHLGVAAVVAVVVAEDVHAADDLDARGVALDQDHRLLAVPVGASGRSCPSR